MIYYYILETPAGKMLLTSDGKTITGMHWLVSRHAPIIEDFWQENREIFAEIISQLDEYFLAKRQVFGPKLTPKGTDFQQKVWQEINKIPYGQTVSYQEIAKAIGSPKAVRAVGTSVGKNPFGIIVPCHRVLASNGSLGGYAGGLESKKLLLKIENIL